MKQVRTEDHIWAVNRMSQLLLPKVASRLDCITLREGSNLIQREQQLKRGERREFN